MILGLLDGKSISNSSFLIKSRKTIHKQILIFRCPWPACNLAVQTLNQLVIHYGLNHKAVAKLLDQNKIGNSKVVESVPGIRSDMMALPATYR